MKQWLVLFFLLFFFAIPTTAETPSALLQLPPFEGVSGVDATYAVQTGNVDSVKVTFTSSLEMKLFDYKDGILKIGIGATDTLDLSEAIGTVTATLMDGTQIAPQLTLQKLILDGKKAAILPGQITAMKTKDEVVLKLSVPSEKNGILLAAAYQEDGRMVTASTIPMKQEKTEYQIPLKRAASAEKVKVFFLNPDFTPMLHAVGVPIADLF